MGGESPLLPMITKNSLKTLKQELNELIKVIDINLSSFSEREKLFDTQADYYEALRIENKVPQDYYKFRFFDVYIYIYYNIQTKKYEVHVENEKGQYYIDSIHEHFNDSQLRFIDLIKDILLAKGNKIKPQRDLF